MTAESTFDSNTIIVTIFFWWNMEWKYFIGENCLTLICTSLILKCFAYS